MKTLFIIEKKIVKQICILFFITSFLGVKGQQNIDPRTFNYSKADSIALHFPRKKYKSYTQIVAPLIEHLNTDQEKARVLFRWITNNITYSYGNPTDNADKVIKEKRAVCAGYSALFKEMCNSAGIECEVINGYSKSEISSINKRLKKIDHAWNALNLYGKWYLVDVTWASSYYDDDKHRFIKAFDNFYWLTPPNYFVRDHFPEDEKWQLLSKPVKKSEFIKPFVYHSNYFEEKISNLLPAKGIIKIKMKDSLEIKFTTPLKIDSSAYAVIDFEHTKFAYFLTLKKMTVIIL